MFKLKSVIRGFLSLFLMIDLSSRIYFSVLWIQNYFSYFLIISVAGKF